ncbi:porin [Tibeticola sp.]|jgi:predicted porin|uniref:porin n=1 Tax=Tibeticola sp. TaxID=2005368 RepID=UPI0025FC5C69|nr:porin [Tibeticola sp.]
MQRRIIALAVAGLASTAAFAQSNVQIYGVVDVGYNRSSSSDTGTFKSRNALDSGLQNGSRIGFRGTEDLGNGLKASFVLEYDIGVDTGAGLAGPSRQSFLALSNAYGTVAAGRQYTPQYELVSKVDPFGAGTVGDVTFGKGVYLMGAWAAPGTIRLDNLLAYVSPSFGGFNVIAGYTANGIGDEESPLKAALSNDVEVWAINPNYSNGPLFVGLNYHQVKSEAPLTGGVRDYKDKVWDLGATYDFGVLKLSALYGQLKSTEDGVVDSKTKQWMVGASVPVGSAGAALVSYSRQTTDFGGGWPDEKASKWAVGYTHALSKRTNLYAVYAKIKTNDAAEGWYSVENPANNDYTSGLNLGVSHSF